MSDTAVTDFCQACKDAPAEPQTAPYCARCDDDLSHLYALFYGEGGLRFCGCGSPEDAYALVRDILTLAPFFEGWETGHANHEKVRALIGTDGAFYLVLYGLDGAGLLEHGGSVGGSWLTAKGRHYLEMMRRYQWDDLEHVGFPHDGDACTPECRHWRDSRDEWQRDRDGVRFRPVPKVPSDDPECRCHEMSAVPVMPGGATVVMTTSWDGSIASAFALYGNCPFHGRLAMELHGESRRAFGGQVEAERIP